MKIKKYTLPKLQVLAGEWCIIFILLLYPVFASISIFLGIPSRPISVGYRIIYLLLALFVLVCEYKNFKKSKYSVALFSIVCFWLVYLCRIIYDLVIDPFTIGFARKGFAYFFQFSILGTAIPMFASIIISKRINYNRLFKNICRVSFLTLASLLFIIYIEVGLSFEIFKLRTGLGDRGTVISAIILSQYGGLFIVASLVWMLKKKISITNLILLSFGVGYLALGASRGPFVAVVFSVFTIFFFQLISKGNSIKYWRNFLVLGSILFLFILRYVVPNFEEFSLLNRVRTSTESDFGDEIRSEQWASAWNQFLDNPIYGDLIVERAYNFYPHNLVLELLMSTGLIGFLFFLYPMSKLVVIYFKEQKQEVRIIVYSAILFFMYSLFSLSMIGIPQFWVLLGLCVGLTSYKLKSSNSQHQLNHV